MQVARSITLTQFMNEEQRKVPGATGDFTGLLSDIATASKMIANAVGKGALIATGKDLNLKIETLANEVLLQTGIATGHLAAMASEDIEGVSQLPSGYPRGKYLLTFDPLNGSGNLDINFQTGTIFSVMRAADARFTASIMISNSMIERLTGHDIGWTMNTSFWRTLSFSLTKMFSLLNSNTSARPRGTPM